MATTEITFESDDRAQVRQALVPAAVAAAAIGCTLSWLFADSRAEAIGEVVLILLLTAVIFGVVVRRGLRHAAAGGRGIAMGVVGLLAVPVAFWSGLPVVLGTAATLLGYAGKRADHGSGKAIAAFVLGLLTLIGYVVVYVGDYVNTH